MSDHARQKDQPPALTPDVQALIADMEIHASNLRAQGTRIIAGTNPKQQLRVYGEYMLQIAVEIEAAIKVAVASSYTRVEGEALIAYVQHKPSCGEFQRLLFNLRVIHSASISPCNCGLSTLLSVRQTVTECQPTKP